MLRVGSLFSGIGGFDLGFERAGMRIEWLCERDKHAQAVLRRHFPAAPLHGDVCSIDASLLAPVDIICGGFPCQDVSVAGKRVGLAGDRSGLFYDAMRIVRRLNPAVLVLENVPGLLSSNRGHDFATVLREVGEGWDCAEVAWRVLDSQYFGVPQRRRRVFIVAVRNPRIGCAEKILALAEGCSRDCPSRGKARKDIAGTIAARFGISRNNPEELVMAGPCAASSSAHMVKAQAFRKAKRAQTETDDETWVDDGIANTLNGFDTGDARTTHAVAYGLDEEQNGAVELMGTLKARKEGGGFEAAVATPLVVRRLTPVECERLQGFPDGWTQVGTDRPTADSHRYKQLGNAVTVNVAEWLGRRIVDALK